jgi:hypothetical protein
MAEISSADVEKLVAELKQWRFGSGKTEPLMPLSKFEEGSERTYTLKGKIENFSSMKNRALV